MVASAQEEKMVIYEVNLWVDRDVADSYLAWLKEHIAEMEAFEGFGKASLLQVENDSEDQVLWSVHYPVATPKDLHRYFEEDAPKMRGDGIRRFEGKFKATRRILHSQ